MGRWILSGGIGSGKSTVRELLEKRGITTIDADSIGHQVILPTGPAFEAVAGRWPAAVVDGVIDRARLAAIVFEDPVQLGDLEAMTHPYIFDTIKRHLEGVGPPVVVEIPLLGHGLGEEWQRLIVDSADTVRLERSIARGMDPMDVRSRMMSQPSRVEWLAIADLVVPNHSTLEDLEHTVSRVAPLL